MAEYGDPRSLAKDICLANHVRTNVVDPEARRVPCGTHLTEANRFWGLVSASGRETLAVLNDWAAHRVDAPAEPVSIEERMAHPAIQARMANAARMDAERLAEREPERLTGDA